MSKFYVFMLVALMGCMSSPRGPVFVVQKDDFKGAANALIGGPVAVMSLQNKTNNNDVIVPGAFIHGVFTVLFCGSGPLPCAMYLGINSIFGFASQHIYNTQHSDIWFFEKSNLRQMPLEYRLKRSPFTAYSNGPETIKLYDSLKGFKDMQKKDDRFVRNVFEILTIFRYAH